MGLNSNTPFSGQGAETLLRDLIFERIGMVFDDAKLDLLASKLTPLVDAKNFSSFLDYYYLLKYDPDSETEWNTLINALTVKETYFWREMDQIHGLAIDVIPSLSEIVRDRPIRIWSSACATGEEPLTIAMRLNEAKWFDRANIEIIASDVSTEALSKARCGVYGGRSFRSLPESLRDKYFHPEGKQWRVSPLLHQRIQWKRANLLHPNAIAALPVLDVIFCRNVFIYFSAETIARVVDSFARRIATPGFLFSGAAESLLKVTDYFELEEIGNAFVYVKRK